MWSSKTSATHHLSARRGARTTCSPPTQSRLRRALYERLACGGGREHPPSRCEIRERTRARVGRRCSHERERVLHDTHALCPISFFGRRAWLSVAGAPGASLTEVAPPVREGYVVVENWHFCSPSDGTSGWEYAMDFAGHLGSRTGWHREKCTASFVRRRFWRRLAIRKDAQL